MICIGDVVRSCIHLNPDGSTFVGFNHISQELAEKLLALYVADVIAARGPSAGDIETASWEAEDGRNDG